MNRKQLLENKLRKMIREELDPRYTHGARKILKKLKDYSGDALLKLDDSALDSRFLQNLISNLESSINELKRLL